MTEYRKSGSGKRRYQCSPIVPSRPALEEEEEEEEELYSDEAGGERSEEEETMEQQNVTNYDDQSKEEVVATLRAFKADVLEMYDCPICHEYMLPPVSQCINGHVLCTACAGKLSTGKCPSCREKIGTTRSLVLDNLAKLLRFPCKFSSSGCPDQLPAESKLKHEATCHFHPVQCCIQKCLWGGPVSEIVSHLRNQHHRDIKIVKAPTEPEFTMAVPVAVKRLLPGPYRVLVLSPRFHFLITFVRDSGDDGSVFAVVQLLGSRADASTLAASISLNDGRRTSAYSMPMASAFDTMADLTGKVECGVFTLGTIHTYAIGDKVSFHVNIKRVDGSPRKPGGKCPRYDASCNISTGT